MRAADFYTFARARHQIYLDRQAGRPEPWTLDTILGTYRFTNVFRELDRTTLWYREHVRDRLAEMSAIEQFMGTVLFRTLNRVTACEIIFCQNRLFGGEPVAWYFLRNGCDGSGASVHNIEEELRDALPTGPWVTGAYIVKTPDGMDKLRGALWIVEEARKRAAATVLDPDARASLAGFHRALQFYPYIGGFTGYEIVSDLRHLPILSDAPDIMTWAHAGPGAVRGLNRLLGRDKASSMRQPEALDLMRRLLSYSRGEGPDFIRHWPEEWPAWEMREVEHTLCEFDKYERVRLGEGKPRGRFR